MKDRNRSPIKDVILPRPGKQLRNQWIDLNGNWLTLVLIGAVSLVIIGGEALVAWLGPARVAGWWWIRWMIPVVFLGSGLFMFVRDRQYIRNLELGIEGEMSVGQLLEDLRADGYRVFHSIGFNSGNDREFDADHLLIGPGGVFLIETKTHSKPGGDAKVIYDGKSILIGGQKPDRDPIVQARAIAKKASALLHDFSGRKVLVQPIVVYPGWFVKNTAPRTDVLVINPAQIFRVLRKKPSLLAPGDIQVLASAIVRYQGQQKT